MDARTRLPTISPGVASTSAFRVVAPSQPSVLPSSFLAPSKASDTATFSARDISMPSFDRLENSSLLPPALFPAPSLPWAPHPACLAQLVLRHRAAALQNDPKTGLVETLGHLGPLAGSGTPYPMPHVGKKLFGCPQCRYMTDRKNNLKRHISTMHQDCSKPLECCGVVFKNKAMLRDHVLIFHSNGYMCRFCGRNFCRKALLKRHLSVHSGQKDFICSHCDYATSHKSNLERHRRVHDRQGAGEDDEDDAAQCDALACSSSGAHSVMHPAYTCAAGCRNFSAPSVGTGSHLPFYKSSALSSSPFGLFWNTTFPSFPKKNNDRRDVARSLSSPSATATRVELENVATESRDVKPEVKSSCHSGRATEDGGVWDDSSSECIDVDVEL